MIYQLIRRDAAWKAMPWVALASAVVWACPPPLGHMGAMIAMGGLFGVMPNRRASRFEAGLPIEARDLLLARMLSLMALIWIPALAGVAGIAAVSGLSAMAVQPLSLGALCTLLVAVLQTAWLKELAAPQWTVSSVFLLPAAGLLLMVKRPVPLLPALCALAGVGLFVRAWAAAPRSFQLGGAGVRAQRTAVHAGRPALLAAFRWAPVWRSVCTWRYLFVVPWMGFQAATGQWLMAPFWVMIAWGDPRMKTRWLWALPVGRRALLWTMMGPILAAQVVGYLAAAPGSEPRVVIVTLAAMLGYAMLTIFFCVLVDWRGFARIPRRIISAAFILVFGIWFVALYFAPRGSTWLRDALVQLAPTAPLGLPALIAAAAAVLVALYWAIEKVFSEPDFADKPKWG